MALLWKKTHIILLDLDHYCFCTSIPLYTHTYFVQHLKLPLKFKELISNSQLRKEEQRGTKSGHRIRKVGLKKVRELQSVGESFWQEYYIYYISLMRKNWTEDEDKVLSTIVGQVGLNDWTAVAKRLKDGYASFDRTGKQCRERWYNHLDPKVNKETWSYQEQATLFELHREMGNRWKEISLKLKGRTDNNIKNHFYSTLRRSLRRLNKVIGQKNSTLHMREIKPSVLTIILNFIYDHQEDHPEMQSPHHFLHQLKGLPQLIFQFAEFKPVKGNMDHAQQSHKKEQIQTIFNLVQQFKDSYYQEKKDKKGSQDEEGAEEQEQEQDVKSHSPLAHHIITSEFRPHQKNVNVIVNFNSNENSPENIPKLESADKERSSGSKMPSEGDSHLKMLDLEDPSPLTHIQDNQYPDLVVIGHHWSPKRKEQGQNEELYIDQILEINYD